MQVRFTRNGDNLRLYVVPESDADRVALGEFAAQFGEPWKTEGVAAVAADWHAGYGFDNSGLSALGPSHVAFTPARIVAECK